MADAVDRSSTLRVPLRLKLHTSAGVCLDPEDRRKRRPDSCDGSNMPAMVPVMPTDKDGPLLYHCPECGNLVRGEIAS